MVCYIVKGAIGIFIGEYIHSIDSKGRIIVPSKFRDELGKVFVISQELDNCLGIYTLSKWEELVEKLNNLPATNRQANAYKRFKLSSAFECEIDKNGRILIPSKLREFAFLEKEVIIIGNGDRVEVWDKACWDKYNEAYDFDENCLNMLSELGIWKKDLRKWILNIYQFY